MEFRVFVLLTAVTMGAMAMSPRESAGVYGADACVRVVVTDDDNHVVSNANVEIYFSLSIREGKSAKGVSDGNGALCLSS